jgi:signal transduction histidine kinase/CheY-like chemotaxis protein
MRTLLPLAAGFLLLAVTALSALALTARQEAAVKLVRHTLEVENRLNLVRGLVTDGETAQRGYLLTHQSAYLTPYEKAIEVIPPEIDRLQAETSDNPEEQSLIAALRPAVRRKVDELNQTLNLARMGRTADAIAIVGQGDGERTMLRIRSIIARMVQNENQLLAAGTDGAERATTGLRGIRMVSGFLVVLLAFAVIRDGRRRLLELEVANQRLEAEIGQRTMAQSQVRQLQKMEAVGQLTGGIAHDFNNMLAIVIGSLDMARLRLSGSEDPRVGKCIDNAAKGAERAATLTARLLAFSRQQALQPQVLDVNKLVGSMSELLRRTLGEQVQVETVLAGGLWRVCADQGQIESALVNLTVNARDAMPSGGKLTIETGNAELDERYAREHDEVTAGQYVLLSVSDTGSGMSAEVSERAFDPFYTTKEVGRGTGLGLSQVFGFVKQSSGHVKIYSEIGRGTTIKLYLPRYSGHDPEAPDRVAGAATVPGGQAQEIILVVEDDDRVRQMSVDALRELGYTVIQAGNGDQAIERLTGHPNIALLFTDIVMPGMTGRQLADRALEIRPDLKVLYTTGYTRNAIVHNGVVDYGVSFLAKPFSIAALAVKIREVLDAN